MDYYPKYALGADLRPHLVVRKMLQFLGDTKDAWANAFWFASANGYLERKAPKELLITYPDRVLKAAEFEALGVQHG